MTKPQQIVLRPIVLSGPVRYRIVESRFVGWHHPAASIIYNLPTRRLCPHAAAQQLLRLPIVETRCSAPDASAPCLGAALKLFEPAVRLRIERRALRGCPFNFEMSAPFAEERAASSSYYVEQDLAGAMMPFTLVRTPLLWLLIATPPFGTEKSDDELWLTGVVPSYYLYTRYRHIIYSLWRSTENAFHMTDVRSEMKRQAAEGPRAPRLQPVQTVRLAPGKETEANASAPQEDLARRTTQLQRYAAGFVELFAKYAELGAQLRDRTRKEALAKDTDAGAVLHRWAVRVLNTIELHLIELFNLPLELQSALLTPMTRVPEEEYTRAQDGAPSMRDIMDRDARVMCTVALTVRRLVAECDARAAAIGALWTRLDSSGAADDDPAWRDLAAQLAAHDSVEQHEDMNTAPDDVLLAVTSADDYGKRVLLPMLSSSTSQGDGDNKP